MYLSSLGPTVATTVSPTGSPPNVLLSFRVSPLRTTWMHIAGTLGALRGIYMNEGLTSLWRGMGPTIVGVMPSRAIYFSTYGAAKGWLAGHLNEGQENALVHLGSALTAGVVTSTATNPIWLVKTRMQLQSGEAKGKGGEAAKIGSGKALHPAASPPMYRNSLHCLQVVAKTEGLRGLYKGLTASYLGTVEGTIQWVLYEKLKRMRSLHRANHARPDPAALTWTDYFLTAASAKLVAAIIAYPHEVLRTRLREDGGKYSGLLQTALRILREEGPTAYYGGMTAHLMRVVPNSAIMFFCYECIVLAYGRLAP